MPSTSKEAAIQTVPARAGILINRFTPDEKRTELIALAPHSPVTVLTDRQLSGLELLDAM